MLRRNLDNAKESNQSDPGEDTDNSKTKLTESEVKQRDVTTTASATGKGSRVRGNRKEGFFSWFDRKDARQIRKIEHPLEIGGNRVRKRRGRRDVVYIMSLVGAFCAGFSGIVFGVYQLVASPPMTTKLSNNLNRFEYFWRESTTTILLPPNAKIPQTLKVCVQRRSESELVPIRIESFQGGANTNQTLRGLVYPTENITSENQSSFHYPNDLHDGLFYYGKERDFGSLELRFLTREGQSREIYREVWEGEGSARELFRIRDDDVENYWAFDDDWLR